MRTPTACKHTVSGSISLAFTRTFHHSLTVLCAIGDMGVFSLTGWFRLIHMEFHVLHATWEKTGKNTTFIIPGYHRLWLSFPEYSSIWCFFDLPECLLPFHCLSSNPGYTTPTGLAYNRFRLFPVRSSLLWKSLLFSLPEDTKIFQFSSFALPSLYIQEGVIRHNPDRVSPFGNLRVIGCLHLTAAYRSLPRPSSPPCPKASTVCS